MQHYSTELWVQTSAPNRSIWKNAEEGEELVHAATVLPECVNARETSLCFMDFQSKNRFVFDGFFSCSAAYASGEMSHGRAVADQLRRGEREGLSLWAVSVNSRSFNFENNSFLV